MILNFNILHLTQNVSNGSLSECCDFGLFILLFIYFLQIFIVFEYSFLEKNVNSKYKSV